MLVKLGRQEADFSELQFKDAKMGEFTASEAHKTLGTEACTDRTLGLIGHPAYKTTQLLVSYAVCL
jgi:hypothetical protein